MQARGRRFEYRAWAAGFPDLPQLKDESFAEEVYLLPLGMAGRNIKLRGDALEIKDLLLMRDGLQLWDPLVRLPFPIASNLIERELLERLALTIPLKRERYDREQLLDEIVGARSANIAVVRLRKRRRLFDAAGSRAESAEVEIGGEILHTAAIEHEDEATARRGVAELQLDRHPNVDYPTALARLVAPAPASGVE